MNRLVGAKFNHEGMETQHSMDKANHYRERAEEMRKIAEGLFDHKERATLLEVAHEYEDLALRGDLTEGYLQLAKGPQKPPNGTAR